jgi:hypothetical protein
MRYLEALVFCKEITVVADSDIVLSIEYIDEENKKIDLELYAVLYSIIDEDKRFLYRNLDFKRNKIKDFIVPALITSRLDGKFNLKVSIEKMEEKTSFNILMEVR